MLLHQRLLRSVTVSTAIGIPTIVVANSLFGVKSSWQSADAVSSGLCSDATQVLGHHCFSGYSPAAQGLTPVTRLVQDASRQLGDLVGHSEVGLTFWLVLVALCALVPLLWATRPAPAQTRAVEILVFGVATTPMLATMESGTSAAFTLPALLWFGIAMARGHSGTAVLAVAVATLLHPPILLLSLLFLARKDISRFAQSAALGTASLFALFITIGHGAMRDFTGWLERQFSASFHLQLQPFPQSVGSGRSVTTVFEVLWTRVFGHDAQSSQQAFRARLSPVHAVQAFITGHQLLVQVIVLLAAVGLLALGYQRGHRLTRYALVVAGSVLPAIVPTVSPTYRLSFILIPVAVLMRAPHAHLEFFDTAPFWLERAAQFVFVVAVTLSIVPTALPLRWLIPVDGYSSVNLFVALAGPAWIVLMMMLVLGMALPRNLAVKSGWRARSAPRRRR